MCGIFGIVSGERGVIEETSKVVKKLFELSESRGKEASGFSFLNGKKIEVYKSPFPASDYFSNKIFVNTLATEAKKDKVTFIGHSRLVTNGYEHYNYNNQPIYKDGITVVHNGIIVNQSQLWDKYSSLKKETELDTELIPAILGKFISEAGVEVALKNTFEDIVGMTSAAMLFNAYNNLLLATNNGSLYYVISKSGKTFIFGSEYFILQSVIQMKSVSGYFDKVEISQLKPNECCSINTETIECELKEITSSNRFSNIMSVSERTCEIHDINHKVERDDGSFNKSLNVYNNEVPNIINDYFNKQTYKISGLKRCNNCILPESFPYIEFDEDGVCNYCRHYVPKFGNKDNECDKEIELKKVVLELKNGNLSNYNCIVAFSGGRDSSYGLHYITKVLGLKPLTFTYDWGMNTNLSRRNVSRICGKLGIENILISADIRKKRDNIKKNVIAWLKRPELGLIPLFMAGDKQFYYYAQKLSKINNIKTSIWMGNYLENTHFKTAFCGISPIHNKKRLDFLSINNKISILLYYLKNYLLNPSLINSSLGDTITSYLSYYGLNTTNFLMLFDYIKWDEKTINDTLINEYNWETDPGTTTTWRIGDGTAAFYNYIYYMVAGFTEIDTFRSNQIREGDLTRKEALEFSINENKPRWDSIKWYCDTIGIDFNHTIEAINNIHKYY
jgi:glutamine---fructose-6-phosphate transaminase (isomerizing)